MEVMGKVFPTCVIRSQFALSIREGMRKAGVDFFRDKMFRPNG